MSYIERAEIKRHLHDVGGAVLDCESAIELAPNYYRSYFIRGDIKFFDLRSFNEGLMDINKALSLVPQNRNNEKADILSLRGMAKDVDKENTLLPNLLQHQLTLISNHKVVLLTPYLPLPYLANSIYQLFRYYDWRYGAK